MTKRSRCPPKRPRASALRTQQIIAYETGVVNTIDPLAGSYFVEKSTLDMENGAFDYFDKLDAMGGMVKAIERGYPQKEIAEASYQFQRAAEAREKVIVGANEFTIEEESPHILYIDESVREQQTAKLKKLKATRSNEEVRARLDALKKAAAQEPVVKGDGAISVGKHHAVHYRSCSCLRHSRRNLRRPARGLRHLRGDQHHLVSEILFLDAGRLRPAYSMQNSRDHSSFCRDHPANRIWDDVIEKRRVAAQPAALASSTAHPQALTSRHF